MCGRSQETDELIGFACARCDKTAGDVDTEVLIVTAQGVP